MTEGVSITESSRTKKRFIFVGIGVCIEPPSGIGCANIPFSSDVNNLTSISLGTMKINQKTNAWKGHETAPNYV
jgi:hypothetical protein